MMTIKNDVNLPKIKFSLIPCIKRAYCNGHSGIYTQLTIKFTTLLIEQKLQTITIQPNAQNFIIQKQVLV